MINQEEYEIFHFIQWEDEEPHSIAELIEEYEDSKEYKGILVIEYFMDMAKESEEEMKKDKAWLKEELVQSYLKESEIYLDGKEFQKSRYFEISEKKLFNLIDQLDEPENLSQELPVIPKFVADWMEENSTGRCAWWKKIAEWEDEVPAKDRKVYDWYAQCNEDTFIIAWITSHYEIEEESLFYVYLGDGHYLVSEDELREPYAKIRHLEYSGFMNHVTRFTEQEIKDYDERYLAFKVPVEEVPND